MKKIGVQELAKMSGISVRTLHHYDRIQLLNPGERSTAGYRLYGERELLILQQILFYKELGFSLKEIKRLLENPEFEVAEALKQHRLALIARKKQVDVLIQSIDYTLKHLNTDTLMKNREKLYAGLPKEFREEYRNEAIQAYGQASIETAEEALMKLNDKDYEALQKEATRIYAELFRCFQVSEPQHKEVQAIIALHYTLTRKFWGTSKDENPQLDQYAGLGALYESDTRFVLHGDAHHPEFAAFVHAAILHFVEQK